MILWRPRKPRESGVENEAYLKTIDRGRPPLSSLRNWVHSYIQSFVFFQWQIFQQRQPFFWRVVTTLIYISNENANIEWNSRRPRSFERGANQGATNWGSSKQQTSRSRSQCFDIRFGKSGVPIHFEYTRFVKRVKTTGDFLEIENSHEITFLTQMIFLHSGSITSLDFTCGFWHYSIGWIGFEFATFSNWQLSEWIWSWGQRK